MSRSVRYLPRREQELLDGLYREGQMTASETYRRTGSIRSYSTVRTQLRVLEHKGYVKRKQRQGVPIAYATDSDIISDVRSAVNPSEAVAAAAPVPLLYHFDALGKGDSQAGRFANPSFDVFDQDDFLRGRTGRVSEVSAVERPGEMMQQQLFEALY
jgi:hypothetical protein